MIGWNEDYEWTYENFHNVIVTAFNINGETRINLDCEHSSYDNMLEIVAWAQNDGYHAEIDSNKETVQIWKQF